LIGVPRCEFDSTRKDETTRVKVPYNEFRNTLLKIGSRPRQVQGGLDSPDAWTTDELKLIDTATPRINRRCGYVG